MLVLSATFSSELHKALVPAARFQKLLERTTRFLRKLAPISPTCAIDCDILESLSKHFFGLSQQ